MFLHRVLKNLTRGATLGLTGREGILLGLEREGSKMSKEELSRENGDTLNRIQDKKNELNVLRKKVTFLSTDLRCIADILGSHGLDKDRIKHGGFDFQEHTPKSWIAKLRDDDFQRDSMKWPDWEEVSGTFRTIESLQREIDSLSAPFRRILED